MSDTQPNVSPDAQGPGLRRTPLAARGEPAVWLTGAALAISATLIIALLAIIAYRGGATFWPRPIERVELVSGEAFLGIPMGEEIAPDGGVRYRYRVGNRDLGQQSFRWVPSSEIASSEPSTEAVLIERRQWGVFIGVPKAALHLQTFDVRQDEDPPGPTGFSPISVETDVLEEADGRRTVRRTSVLAKDGTLESELPALLGEARERRRRIEQLNDHDIPRIQEKLSKIEYRVRAAEIEHERTLAGTAKPWPIWAWGLAILTGAGAFAGARALAGKRSRRGGLARSVAWIVFAASALAVLMEHPWAGPSLSSDRLASVRAEAETKIETLTTARSEVLKEIDVLRAADARWRVQIVDPLTGRFAPRSQSDPDVPMLVSQIDRLVRPTDLGTLERLGVYFGRWGDFLSLPPGEEPGTGGVYPVIIGTVTLTLLLTVSVVPLGVIAALYLREYAPQGVITSAIRVAINNLAGVPSIVYGMFGLGFFCYAVGGYVDGGPGSAALPRGDWWTLLGVCGLLIAGGAGLWCIASAGRDAGRDRVAAIGRWIAAAVWLGALATAAQMVATTPYFGGFFAEKLPEQPTFGGRGILWASLTLALLTLPVVIVATEEAIAAVPGSMREGSYGCGASRWQTVRRIVLPSALPGIMTGAILAMARGAGEVAPLMLVGAVNLAPAPPVTLEAPFLHGDRTFMHLGFHIYNLGFQSPDAEAAEPLVWTTTLLLVGIVLVLNLVAVIIRARLRRATGAAI
ncbi:MAG: ABC transporter permease subunit [Planctomycetota bacterium]